MTALPKNIARVLSKNQDIVQLLLVKYPIDDGYWVYLDDLVQELEFAGCEDIERKMMDVDNTSKFDSTVSELEIARLLSCKGKHVKMLPDNFLEPAKSPDMYVTDSLGEYFVEVVRFSEDSAIAIFLDELTKLLVDPAKPIQVDVQLSQYLSEPVINHEDRRVKEEKARTIMNKFAEAFIKIDPAKMPSKLPSIDGVTFSLSRSPISRGSPGFINGKSIIVPSAEFVSRIRFLVTDRKYGKAVKRTTWTGDYLKKHYIIAIDCHQMADEEVLLEALLGKRESYSLEPPTVSPPPQVKQAAQNNWTAFLENTHMLPKARTIYPSYEGVYLTDTICENVSGVLLYVRLGAKVFFVPNPFADRTINDSRLTNFYT